MFIHADMLRVLKFPEILKSVLNDGVEGVVLMTGEGNILSAVSIEGAQPAETVVAAVSACIFTNYTLGIPYGEFIRVWCCGCYVC